MSDNVIYTLDAFKEHAKTVSRHFASRRDGFLKRLKFRCIIAGILLITFPFWYSLVTRWDTLGGDISSVGALVTNVLAGGIIVVLILAWALRPMFRYRYDTLTVGNALPGQSGVVQQPVGLKSRVFTRLLSYFGDFNMYEERKLSLRRFQKAPNLPAFDTYDATDYIRGYINGVRVELSEVLLQTQREGVPQKVFRGLFILLDINDSAVVLRGKFNGNTVLLVGNETPNDLLLKKYDGYQRVQLPDDNYGRQVRAVSNNMEEAGRLLSSEFIAGVMKLSEALQQAKNQDQAVDDKIVLALENIATGVGDVMAATAASILHWFKTGSFKQAATRHNMRHSNAQPVEADAHWFSSGVQCSIFDDKILISLPTRHNLFEPDSLFHPPLTEDDIELSYKVMSVVSDIVGETVENLPKGMAA